MWCLWTSLYLWGSYFLTYGTSTCFFVTNLVIKFIKMLASGISSSFQESNDVTLASFGGRWRSLEVFIGGFHEAWSIPRKQAFQESFAQYFYAFSWRSVYLSSSLESSQVLGSWVSSPCFWSPASIYKPSFNAFTAVNKKVKDLKTSLKMHLMSIPGRYSFKQIWNNLFINCDRQRLSV